MNTWCYLLFYNKINQYNKQLIQIWNYSDQKNQI